MIETEIKSEGQKPEVNHETSGREEAARIQKEIQQERAKRETECLKRIKEILEELNCTIEAFTILSSRKPQPVAHQYEIVALDWPAEG